MGSTYTYLVTDLLTGTILDELPLSGVVFDKKLNDAGSLRGELHVDDPNIQLRQPRLLTEPGRTALYVDRDGDLLWGGIVWTTRYTGSDAVLEIGASDFLSYFDHRIVLDPANLNNTVSRSEDQILIAQDMITLAAGHAGGDLGIVFSGVQSSGVTRSVSYAPGDLKMVADVLRDLSNTVDGLDFAFDVGYDEAGALQKLLRLGFPQLGQPGSELSNVWEYGANLADFVWPADGSSMGTRVFGLGDSSLGATPVMAADSTALTTGWPLLEVALSPLDTADATMLTSYVTGELAAQRRPVVLPELTVRADLDPIVGTYAVGDNARVIITDPFFHPDTLDVTVRITGFEVTPGDDAGEEQVVLTIAPLLETS